MTPTERLVSLIARSLPVHVRGRFREEWLADIRTAPTLGISRGAVLRAALCVSLRLDRADPAATGIPRRIAAVRFARWAAAFLCTALILATTAFLLGVDAAGAEELWRPLTIASAGTSVLSVCCALIGVLPGVGALRAGLPVFGPKRIALMLSGGIAAVVSLAFLLLVPLLGIFVVLGAISCVLLLAAGGPRGQRPQAPLPARSRAVLAAGFTVVSVAAVALGTLQTLVWNPRAKVSGLSLDRIYAAMESAGQGNGIGAVAVWATLFLGASAALPFVCSRPALGGPRSTRQITVAGSALVAFTGVTHWFAAFPNGISLADTFFVSGGDELTAGSALLSVMTVLSLLLAVFAAFVPVRWRPVASGPPRASGRIAA